jgi:putative endopeptidase
MGAPVQRLDVNQPTFITGMAQLVKTVPVSDWRVYFKFQLLDDYAPALSAEFADLEFGFHSKTLADIQEQRPRWRRAVKAMDDNMGEIVGRMFVESHFGAEAKAHMLVLVGNLLRAFDTSIDDLEWMSPATRAEAKKKLSKITVKIGYPDKWRDYSTLSVRSDDLVGNLLRSAEFQHQRYVNRAGGPVDKGEWLMTPQTVNAYYNPTRNEIVFPAGILQPPYFDMEADDAANYGATGGTIGHEISHGFDDEGSQYDGDGKLDDWWTQSDRKAFDRLTGRLVTQFNAYAPLPGRKVNGKLTLGENIADLSGLEIAHKAYLLSLKGKPAPVIDGMTGDQRFFYAYAQSWREKEREERTLRLLTMDPHAPARFRCNGPVLNIDAFHQAFDTKPGDGMYKAPKERIRIW